MASRRNANWLVSKSSIESILAKYGQGCQFAIRLLRQFALMPIIVNMQTLTPDDIVTAVKAAGLSMHEFCRQIGVTDSVFSRWKHNRTLPSLRTYHKFEEGIARLADGKEAAE